MAVNTMAVVLGAFLLLLRATCTEACGKDIQLSNLTINITSPGYPSLYNSSLSCEWRINASSPGHLVGILYNVQFGSSNCLSFYDGSDNSGRLLLRMCGTHKGGILSSGNTMYIQLTSSASSYGTSFVLTVNNTERCGGSFIATPQLTNLTLPVDPYVSYSNLNCQWIITSENETNTVQVQGKFHLLPSESCTHDVVRVYNGNTTEADQFLGEYCSTQMPFFYSSVNSLLLVLTTDGYTTSSGLQMQYSSRPEGDCNRTHTIFNTSIYILSPGYPNSYSSNLSCYITLLDPTFRPNMRLDVITADMDGNYSQCDTESVRLIAGYTGHYYLAGEFCGNSSISPIGPYYSNGRLMILVFNSSSDTSGMLFRLRVSHTLRKVIPHQSNNCGPQFRNATAHPKILSSPGYPVLPTYLDLCVWKLTASNPQMMVRIVVTDSDFQMFESVCDLSYFVKFYNGPSIFNETIYTWCGQSKPTLQTTGAAMTIQFDSALVYDLKGFRLKYFATNETYKCGGTVNITEIGNTTLTGQYQNSQDCHWTIHAPDNMNIQAKVIYAWYSLEAPKPIRCNADYVEIYSGSFRKTNSTSTGKWCCGYSEGFISSGRTITARFHTGIENECRGIQLILKAGHFNDYSMTSLSAEAIIDKYFSSPNYPFSYPSNIEKTWKIDAGEYYAVKINVTYSQLETSVGCQNDYVEAFDGSDAKATSLGRWCGGTTPNKTSTGSVIFLKFKSNSFIVGRGFVIKYRAGYIGANVSKDSTGIIIGGSVAGVVLLFIVLGGMCESKRKPDGDTTASTGAGSTTESVSFKTIKPLDD